MSAYIVDESTLYRVINTLSKIEGYNDKLKSIKSMSISNPKKLFKKLNLLNKYSLSQRYQDEVFTKKETYPFNLNDYIKESNNYNKFQNLKSLRCFLYQSCEGKAKNKDLYKLLNTISKDIAFDIVNELQEYKQTEWK